MTITVGINGFGRIGRCTLNHIASSGRNDISVIKANATGPLETAAHLLRYDSVHGRFGQEIRVGKNSLDLGAGEIEMFSTYDPTELDWSGCDVVLECTGQFNDGHKAAVHLDQGAKSVLISSPAKNVQKTIVYGVNDDWLETGDTMISNGSCTTNCLAPLAKVLDEAVGLWAALRSLRQVIVRRRWPALAARCRPRGQRQGPVLPKPALAMVDLPPTKWRKKPKVCWHSSRHQRCCRLRWGWSVPRRAAHCPDTSSCRRNRLTADCRSCHSFPVCYCRRHRR